MNVNEEAMFLCIPLAYVLRTVADVDDMDVHCLVLLEFVGLHFEDFVEMFRTVTLKNGTREHWFAVVFQPGLPQLEEINPGIPESVVVGGALPIERNTRRLPRTTTITVRRSASG